MLLFFLFLLIILLQIVISSFLSPMPASDAGTVRYRSIPVMTLVLIFANAIIFIAFEAVALYPGSSLLEENPFDPQGIALINRYLEVVWRFGYRALFMTEGQSVGAFVTFTSIFLHGDFWHLFYNMLFLWAFGRRVEDACGAWRYLLYYVLAGMIANLASVALNPGRGDLPGIGASGAIAGVMGAYLILFPGAMVTSFWGLGILLRVPVVFVLKVIVGMRAVQAAPLWRWTIRLPAWVLLISFLIQNTLPSVITIQTGQGGGVDTVAHVAGFLSALLVFLFVRKDLLTRYFAGRRI
jgi:membrane associated rhomboid family serine protease